jgi:prepilin peptidase CpaA
MVTPTLPQLAPLAIAAVACVTDLRSRRIPNWLTLSGAAAAFGFYLAGHGLSGLGWSAGGWAVGLAVFLPFFLLRGIGGGDVKLVAALGAWVGPVGAIWVGLYAAIAGGPLALGMALSRGYARQAFSNIWGLVGFWRLAGVRPQPGLTLETAGAGAPRLPYALPIAAGLVLTLWLR